MQDFMSLLASFSGRFYRLRSRDNQQKLLNRAGEALERSEETPEEPSE
jgi:putative resolvase